jgi:hypothetical protein
MTMAAASASAATASTWCSGSSMEEKLQFQLYLQLKLEQKEQLPAVEDPNVTIRMPAESDNAPHQFRHDQVTYVYQISLIPLLAMGQQPKKSG